MFSWDPRKAAINLDKHGIAFEEAATVFSDDQALDWEDAVHSRSEVRHKRLGMSHEGQILLVVYTLRRVKNEETIRIISARFASRKERKAYEG